MQDTLLIIEDESLLGQELVRYYRRQGWDVHLAKNLAGARRLLSKDNLEPLVVLSDMSLPDGNALDLLESLRGDQAGAGGEWIFLTGYGSVPDSVRALRLGAFDFLEKPCEQERLDLVMAGAARSAAAQRRLREESAQRRQGPEAFAGRSAAARRVRDMLARLSQVPFSALVITGETGTGKGLAARILHHAGTRAHGPLVEVNCAALPRDLLESELFGHEAGAFTGAKGRRRGLIEQADGGTLFLDEIGELDPELQSKLLKALEDHAIRRLGGEREIRVDVQFIAATNQNLAARVQEGRFRGDLFHRLTVFQLELPPLRARKEDLEDLVPGFIADFNSKAGKRVRTVPTAVWQRLRAHAWPGNVRELRNVVERCVLFAEDEEFPLHWLQLASLGPGAGQAANSAGASLESVEIEGDRLCLPLDGSMALDDMDRHIIQTALERNRYNVTATARALSTTRETLRYRIQKYGLTGG